MPRTTVHVVMQAHLDPVWLWPWQAGLDEALATCRTACDLLDRYPDTVFTANEAWRYEQLRELAPDVFDRVRAHIRAGRWEVVGGWWIQPDCNFPSGFAIERQIDCGKRWFREHLGLFPEIAYNVDSFGHAATLPGCLRAAGQKYYVMMRPQEHEMPLPARLFRWRGFPKGPEVVVFRIAGAYCTGGSAVNPDHIRRACTELPKGVAHTMCFIGVGDHGGGMTAKLIEWVRDNAESIDGCRLVFSSPARFFKAVSAHERKLPLVTGELQMHAVGCYTVERGIKTRVRRAEHLLRQAEIVAEAAGAAPGDWAALEEAWRLVAFNQFHDTLGGTCIPSAYAQQYDQLGAAATVADQIAQSELRRRLRALPDDPDQRIVLLNASDAAFSGWIEHEPWTQWRRWEPSWRLIDEKGRAVPFQILPSEAVAGRIPRLLFRLDAASGVMRIVRVQQQGGGASRSRVTAGDRRIANDRGVSVSLSGHPALAFDAVAWEAPRLEIVDDRSDTWSHGIDRYADGPALAPVWDTAFVVERGPLMASLHRTGRIGGSTLHEEWRVYAGENYVDLRLAVNWRELHKVLKLTLPLAGDPAERIDGIPGGALQRPNSGREVPIRDWTACGKGGDARAVVSPDVYALDATPARLRLTLLRSPWLAHHDPRRDIPPGARIADQGEHLFRFRLFAGAKLTPDLLDRHALSLHRPLLAADLTRGMPGRGET